MYRSQGQDALQEFVRFAFRNQADGTFAIASNSFVELGHFEELRQNGCARASSTGSPLQRWAPLYPLPPILLGRLFLVSGILKKSTLRFLWAHEGDRRYPYPAPAAGACRLPFLFGLRREWNRQKFARANGPATADYSARVIEGIDLWRHAVFQPRDRAGEKPDLFQALARAILATDAFPELASTQTTPEWLGEELRENSIGLCSRRALPSAQPRAATPAVRGL